MIASSCATFLTGYWEPRIHMFMFIATPVSCFYSRSRGCLLYGWRRKPTRTLIRGSIEFDSYTPIAQCWYWYGYIVLRIWVTVLFAVIMYFIANHDSKKFIRNTRAQRKLRNCWRFSEETSSEVKVARLSSCKHYQPSWWTCKNIVCWYAYDSRLCNCLKDE